MVNENGGGKKTLRERREKRQRRIESIFLSISPPLSPAEDEKSRCSQKLSEIVFV
jgi:hypothetical protein